MREDAITCGPTCKKRRQRRLAAEAREIPDAMHAVTRSLEQLHQALHRVNQFRPSVAAGCVTRAEWEIWKAYQALNLVRPGPPGVYTGAIIENEADRRKRLGLDQPDLFADHGKETAGNVPASCS